MPITEEQNKWLARFTGGKAGAPVSGLPIKEQLQIARASEEAEASAQREVYRAKMRRDVAELKAEMEGCYHADVATIDDQTMKMIDPDQTEAFDFVADIHNVKLGAARENAMSAAKVKLTLIEQRLLDVPFAWSRIADGDVPALVRDKTDPPLFTKEMLMDELYTPLVRELILPETFVERDFSRVQQMIDSTNDFYIKELEEIGENAERDENVTLIKGTITALGSIATNAIGMSQLSAADTAKAAGYATLATAALTAGVDVVVAVQDRDPRKGVTNVLSGIANSAGFAVTQASGSKELGKYLALSITAAAKAPDLVAAIRDRDTDGILNGIIAGVDIGMGMAAVEMSGQQATDFNKAKVATVAGLRLAVSARNLPEVVQSGDWAAVRSFMIDATMSACKTALTFNMLDQKADIADQKKAAQDERKLIAPDDTDALAEIDAKIEKLDKAMLGRIAKGTAVDGAVDQTTARLKALNDSLSKKNADLAADVAEAEEAQKLAVEEQLAVEREEFESALELLGQKKVLNDSELKSLSKMVQKMQQDKVIMETAATVGSAGFAVASQFLAPLAMGGTIIAFSKSLAAAVDRAISLRKWTASSEEAYTTISPYYTSIQNFVKNNKEQFSHYTIKSALLLLQVAAQITATAGTGTPVQGIATIVDKGLKIAESLEELTYKFYQRGELEAAWKATKPALANPDNRKANLIARRVNPTLAKYSIAYGAVIAKDVIAVTALNRIGLDRETLAQKDAKVALVKQYLELRYSDDNKVLKEYKSDRGWMGKVPDPELSARAWMLSVKIAIDEGGLSSGQDQTINHALQEHDRSWRDYERDERDGVLTKLLARDYLSRLNDCSAALLAFAPQKGEGESHMEMIGIRTQYCKLVSSRIRDVEVAISQLAG